MDPITSVSFNYANHNLDIIYNCIEKKIQFNKCIVDKNIEFSIQDIWVNEQPAEFLRNFRSTLINHSDLSHFSFTQEGIHLYFIKPNQVEIEILDETDRNVAPRKIHLNLDTLEVKGLEKILKLASDKSLFNNRGDHLKNDFTLKECCVKANAQLIIKNYVCSETDSFDDDMLNEITINEVDIDPNIKSKNPVPTLPKTRFSSFSSGLNLMGKCQDSACEAFSRPICIQKGLGEFEIKKVCQESVCLCCKGKLSTVGRIFLNDCVYLITGTLHTGESRSFRLQTVRSTKTMTLFNNLNEMTSKWKNLTLTLEKSPETLAFPTGVHCLIGGSVIILAAYIFYNMKQNTK